MNSFLEFGRISHVLVHSKDFGCLEELVESNQNSKTKNMNTSALNKDQNLRKNVSHVTLISFPLIW